MRGRFWNQEVCCIPEDNVWSHREAWHKQSFFSAGLGKLVRTLCAVSRVLVLSLQIPIIAGNFETFHKNMQKGEKADKMKKQLDEVMVAEEKERIFFCAKSNDSQEDHSYKRSQTNSIVSFSSKEKLINQTKTWTNNTTIKNRKSLSPRSPDQHC